MSQTPIEPCEFCEIDGYGYHAPRCPVQLESELAALEKLTAIDREAHRGLHEENERLELELSRVRAELEGAKATIERQGLAIEHWKQQLEQALAAVRDAGPFISNYWQWHEKHALIIKLANKERT